MKLESLCPSDATTCSALVRWVDAASEIKVNTPLWAGYASAKTPLIELVEVMLGVRHDLKTGYHWEASIWSREDKELSEDVDVMGASPEEAIENALKTAIAGCWKRRGIYRDIIVGLCKALRHMQNAQGMAAGADVPPLNRD